MLPESSTLKTIMQGLLPESVDLLCELIAIPSIRGAEGPVSRHAAESFRPFCDTSELIPFPLDFTHRSDYVWPNPEIHYADTCNLRLSVKGASQGRSLILNAHSDVVPPSEGQKDPYKPKVENDIIYGRGACDDKGQFAVIHLLLRTMKKLKLRPKGSLTVDFVVEEENGGNGSLLAVQDIQQHDAAIVLEPTNLKICAAVRGAVWFELTATGKAGHSGSPGKTRSALKIAIEAMRAIEAYHDTLLASSHHKNPLFVNYPDPMPVTFGQINSGDWPATAPAQAIVKGVFGFLPDLTMLEVQNGLQNILRQHADPWVAEHTRIDFNMLNNEGNALAADHELVATLAEAGRDIGHPLEIIGMTAACDAWRYDKIGIPTVVFGAGDLWQHAHSADEQISTKSIVEAALILMRFIDRWSGWVEEVETKG
jgi:acetylornithine deacetylase